MPRMLRVGMLVLAIALTACSSSPTGVFLTNDARSYKPGDEVKIELRNASLSRVGYNLCYVQLQLKDGETWHSISHLAPNEACTSELRVMPPGASAKGKINLPSDLQEGTYRLSGEFEVGDDRTAISTATFRVGGMGKS